MINNFVILLVQFVIGLWVIISRQLISPLSLFGRGQEVLGFCNSAATVARHYSFCKYANSRGVVHVT